MQRTVIQGTNDGSLLITREAPVGIPGTSKDRRKAQRVGVAETWRTLDRVITRDLLDVPSKGRAWFSGCSLAPATGVAAENDTVALYHTMAAGIAVRAIAQQTESFSLPPAKKIRVELFEELSDTVAQSI